MQRLLGVCGSQSEKPDIVPHERAHCGDKPYSRPLREYRCSKKPDIVLHGRVHCGDKPYSRPVCEYRCSVGRVAARHVRMIANTFELDCAARACAHQREAGWPLNVEASLSLTGFPSHLLRIERVHSGEKQIACSMW